MSIITVLVLAFLITQNEAAKILAMFPVPSISHQVVFRPLTQELAKRGHEVTVITPDPAFPKGQTPPNYTEIDLHDLSYTKWQELFKHTSKPGTTMMEMMQVGFKVVIDITEAQFKDEAVQELLQGNNSYDILLLEACVRPALLLSHRFKVPVIQVSSFGPLNYNVETVGASWHPLLYPNHFNQRIYNMTKWEKVIQLWDFYRLESHQYKMKDVEHDMGKRLFGPDVPTLIELQKNVDMLFLNIHPLWEGNRPVPPSVIYMGGLHQKPITELPADLKNFLDSSVNGVIYISFGTNVQPSLLPPEKIQTLVNVFSQLPYDVLWKWDKDELPGRTENIRISKWLPQSDLLRHPKLKLFITQGGLQSTDEAITAGVPMVGMPMLADQWYNVEKYVHHKIGAQVDMVTLNEEDFKNAIYTVIGDDSYRRNVERLRALMTDQPQSPLERAVWWTEHVLRHGGGHHLRGPASNITWAEYLELELVLTLLGIASVIILVLFTIVYALFKSICKSGKTKNE